MSDHTSKGCVGCMPFGTSEEGVDFASVSSSKGGMVCVPNGTIEEGLACVPVGTSEEDGLSVCQ